MAPGTELQSIKSRHVVMIDNFDSFTFNLVQYFQELQVRVTVIRNDEKPVADILAMRPDFVTISPGPSDPQHAGVCLDLIKAAVEANLPLLGVCLGHQAIGQALGATIVRAPAPVHGKASPILHDGKGVFAGLPSPLKATRYHSLVIDPATLPECLVVSAKTAEGIIMGVRHRSCHLEGVQFHPESVLTEYGRTMLKNFVLAVSSF